MFGKLGVQTVVCLQGRFHYYEGHSMQKCTLAVRVMASLGIKMMVVTNAAGGVLTESSMLEILWC